MTPGSNVPGSGPAPPAGNRRGHAMECATNGKLVRGGREVFEEGLKPHPSLLVASLRPCGLWLIRRLFPPDRPALVPRTAPRPPSQARAATGQGVERRLTARVKGARFARMPRHRLTPTLDPARLEGPTSSRRPPTWVSVDTSGHHRHSFGVRTCGRLGPSQTLPCSHRPCGLLSVPASPAPLVTLEMHFQAETCGLERSREPEHLEARVRAMPAAGCSKDLCSDLDGSVTSRRPSSIRSLRRRRGELPASWVRDPSHTVQQPTGTVIGVGSS